MAKSAAFQLAPPELQVVFAHRLVELQKTHLQAALLKTVADLDITALDKQLAAVMPVAALQKLASFGLRGEALFMAPMVLQARPTLVIDQQFLNGLSLLSIGPQLRGGRNNERGEAGIEEVYQLILKAVAHAKPVVSGRKAMLHNAAGRLVAIEVAADPDIVILEKSSGQSDRPLVAIEVKAGTDVSNIHNRIGEAEKSHLKAKARKFTECWTIVNVARLDPVVAKQQSPTTHRFFTFSELMDTTSKAHIDFVASIVALAGIKTKSKPPARTKKS